MTCKCILCTWYQFCLNVIIFSTNVQITPKYWCLWIDWYSWLIDIYENELIDIYEIRNFSIENLIQHDSTKTDPIGNLHGKLFCKIFLNFAKKKNNNKIFFCNVDFESGSVLMNTEQLTHRKQLGFEVTGVGLCDIYRLW